MAIVSAELGLPMAKTGISNAEFPRDLPASREKHFLVVVCEPDGINWSIHEGSSSNFAPAVFWTTPHIEEEDRSIASCMPLTRFLCPQAMIHIFGQAGSKLATKQRAHKTASERAVPFTTVYILSNTSKHEADVGFLFSEVPARLFRLAVTDFFTNEQLGSSKPLTSVGHFAALYAAQKDYNSPVLLLTGGSAITYVALNKDATFLGGGACAGMPIRCRTLFDYCSQEFPSIDFKRYKEITDTAKKDKKPISLFATDMEAGIAANATAEMAGQLRNIVKQFLKLVGPSEVPLTVIITGTDTDILRELLQENCSNMVEPEPSVSFPLPTKVTFPMRRNMPSYGVQHLLSAQRKQQVPLDSDEALREDLIGLRAAAYAKNDAAGTYRGSVVRIVRGRVLEEDQFVLLLDNGENLYLNLVELYDALALYAELGEVDQEEDQKEWVGEKKEAMGKVQATLEGKTDAIKKRKIQLDAAKEIEGSIAKMVSRPAKEKEGSIAKMVSSPPKGKQGTKRARSTPKKKDHSRYVGLRVAKYFDNPTPDRPENQSIFFGTVDKYYLDSEEDEMVYHVRYDDSDEEEFDLEELREVILLYDKNKEGDSNRPSL